MIPSSFARETITRLRYPRTTDFGTDVPDYAAEPARLDIERCWAEPAPSQELEDGRRAVSTGWTIAAPNGVDLRADDRVEYQGAVYEIVGEPQRVPSPTMVLAHTRITLNRWEG